MDICTKRVFSACFRHAILVNSKRFRGKVNLRRPRPPHFEKARLLEFTKPHFQSYFKDKSMVELCNKNIQLWKKDNVENPYQRLLANDLYDKYINSKLICFYHLNTMKAEDQHKAFIMFKKQNMFLSDLGKKTVEMAIKGTPYETVLSLFTSRNMTLFCRDPDISKMLTITKKFPQLVLMAAIFEGTLLSRDEINYYSQIPDLKAAQSGLVQMLDRIGGNVVNQLSSHQTNLINQLEARVKQLELEKAK
ncbi:39S ribosomal protein L10, mitochondrial [Agrilus planipennis]|uniref:Large ribosomal subunit protein uL10m n=1 Tax=Agrilus planipennis TaxID=224129 RepID=A0A1W4WL21_AGRPL|nr:39S ribosomal protein L10, mitochondrial [Agrilus planipennis]